MLSALAGANMIYGLGMVDLGMTMDFAQLVVDNEIAKMIRRVICGIPVSDETMATDLIRSVGAGGHFLMEDHTVKYMGQIQSVTTLFDRQPYAQWYSKGKKDLAQRALEETKRILSVHKPKPLDKNISQKLHDIIAETAQEHGIEY